jgi:hypothetical protein
LNIGVSVSIKKDVKCGSAAQACFLAILLAFFYINISGGSTGVKVVGIVGEGLCKRNWRVHRLMLHWWLGCSGNMVDWGCCMVNKGWWDRCGRCWCRRGW